MTDDLKSDLLRSRPLGLAAGLLIVAAAGAASLDENRARYLLASPVARRELAESLRRFDNLSDADQQAVRAIDDRLNALPPSDRETHLVVLRRFHNWLGGLPEPVRDGLLAKPAAQRLAEVKALIARYPLPDVQTRSPLNFIQKGGTCLFEVASLCKTWLAISPDDRKKVDALAPGNRRAELHRLSRAHGIPIELKPADFDEAAWAARAEDRLKEIGSGGGRPKVWIAKIETREAKASEKRKENSKHRLAVNLYVQEHESPPGVAADRLIQFFGATPSWVQSTFNVFPSDEARRRLTLIYRLIYPAPQEFSPMAAPPGVKARTTPPDAAKAAPPPHPAPSTAPTAPSTPPPKPATPF